MNNITCPICGCDCETREIERTLPYGENNQTILVVTVPLRKCSKCGFEFLDYIGEDRQEEAIRRYLEQQH